MIPAQAAIVVKIAPTNKLNKSTKIATKTIFALTHGNIVLT